MSENEFPSPEAGVVISDLLRKDDRTLALAVHEGDSLAAVALLQRYYDPIFNLVLAATGIAATAEEVTEAVIVGRLRHLAQRPPATDEPRWIVLLAAHAWKLLFELCPAGQWRTRRLRISPRHWDVERLQLADDARPSPQRAAQRLRHHFWQAFSRLSMQQRFILALVERHRVSADELGRVLAADEAEARRLRNRAKLALLNFFPGKAGRAWSRKT